jgi:hypothetical protein
MNINYNNFINERKSDFGLGNFDQLNEIKVQEDNFPYMELSKRQVLHKFQQTYKLIPVEDAIFHIWEKNNQITRIDGRLVSNINLSTTPTLNEVSSLNLVIAFLGVNNHYIWQDAEWEDDIKMEQNDPNSTNFPKGDLILFKEANNLEFIESNYKLAWRFEIVSILPFFSKIIYIDAQTGSIRKVEDAIVN